MSHSITAAEVAQKLALDANLLFVDVRTPSEVASGKIENALELDVYGVHPDEMTARISEYSEGKDVIVYCASGARSDLVCRHLHEQGVENAKSLAGGFTAWQQLHSSTN